MHNNIDGTYVYSNFNLFKTFSILEHFFRIMHFLQYAAELYKYISYTSVIRQPFWEMVTHFRVPSTRKVLIKLLQSASACRQLLHVSSFDAKFPNSFICMHMRENMELQSANKDMCRINGFRYSAPFIELLGCTSISAISFFIWWQISC